MDPETLETLLAEREIRRQLVRFARAMDERNWDVLHDILLEDATSDVGTGPLEGSAALITTIRSFLDRCGTTQHLLGNVLIDVDLRAGTASSQAYVNDLHLGKAERAELTFATLGDYHDRWERRDGAWRLAHRTKLSRATVGSFDVFA